MHVITIDENLTMSAPSTSGFKGLPNKLPDYTGFVALNNQCGYDLQVSVTSGQAIASSEDIQLIASSVTIPNGEKLYLAADCASDTTYPLTLSYTDDTGGSHSNDVTLTIMGRVGAPKVTAADDSTGELSVWASCRANGLSLIRNDKDNQNSVDASSTSTPSVTADPGQSKTLAVPLPPDPPDPQTITLTLSGDTSISKVVTVYDQQTTTLNVKKDSNNGLYVDTRAITVAPGTPVTLTVTNFTGDTDNDIQIDVYSVDASGKVKTISDSSDSVGNDGSKLVTLDDTTHYLSICNSGSNPPPSGAGAIEDPKTGMYLWDDPIVLVKHSGRGTVGSGSSGG